MVNFDSNDNKGLTFSLERDMQAVLRREIRSLGIDLKIVDGGKERKVASGFIDITCRDSKGFVVIELKKGQADRNAVGQILGYIGDLKIQGDTPVRGILIAESFHQNAKSAARMVPRLTLVSYKVDCKVTFQFTHENRLHALNFPLSVQKNSPNKPPPCHDRKTSEPPPSSGKYGWFTVIFVIYCIIFAIFAFFNSLG